MKAKVKAMQDMAVEKVGDGKTPNLFFVSDEDVVILISRDFLPAYRVWKELDRSHESTLEDRQFGVICSVELGIVTDLSEVMKMTFAIGDRVRMVQTDTSGVIAGVVRSGAGKDGSDRIPIRWDRSGIVSEWDPGFLRPANTNPTDDPDEVVVGNTRRRRGRMYRDSNNILISIPEGFSRVS